MTSESLKLYKLIILYLLNQTNHIITNAIISDFILQHGYTDYFSIQETLAALAEDHMIREDQTHSSTYYTITGKGKETLDFFFVPSFQKIRFRKLMIIFVKIRCRLLRTHPFVRISLK